MIVYNYDADLEVSDNCVRSSLLSSVKKSCVRGLWHHVVRFEKTIKVTTIDIEEDVV